MQAYTGPPSSAPCGVLIPMQASLKALPPLHPALSVIPVYLPPCSLFNVSPLLLCSLLSRTCAYPHISPTLPLCSCNIPRIHACPCRFAASHPLPASMPHHSPHPYPPPFHAPAPLPQRAEAGQVHLFISELVLYCRQYSLHAHSAIVENQSVSKIHSVGK